MFPHLANKGLLVAKAAVTAHDSIVPVRLFNTTGSPQTVNKGEWVATFQLWEDKPDLEPYAHTDTTHTSHINDLNTPPQEFDPDIDWSHSSVTED